MPCSGPDHCLEWDAFLNKKQMSCPEAKTFLLEVRFKRTEFSVRWGKDRQFREGRYSVGFLGSGHGHLHLSLVP